MLNPCSCSLELTLAYNTTVRSVAGSGRRMLSTRAGIAKTLPGKRGNIDDLLCGALVSCPAPVAPELPEFEKRILGGCPFLVGEGPAVLRCECVAGGTLQPLE